MTRPILTLLALLALGLSPSPAFGNDLALDHPEIFFSDPSAPRVLRASVAWGAIAVRGHDGDGVSVAARIEGDRSRGLSGEDLAGRLELVVEERANVVEVRVRSEVDGFHGVFLEIGVPREVALELEMQRGGDIRLEGLDGEVDVSNRNGSVSLQRMGGAAVVNARNGSIEASFDRVAPGLPMSFVTLNGSVDVTFPHDFRGDVRVRYARGEVRSEFELVAPDGTVWTRAEPAADPEERLVSRVVRGRIDGGDTPVRFHTANGSVILRRGEAAGDGQGT